VIGERRTQWKATMGADPVTLQTMNLQVCRKGAGRHPLQAGQDSQEMPTSRRAMGNSQASNVPC